MASRRGGLAAVLIVVGAVSGGAAQEPTPEPTASAENAGVHFPLTAEDHLAEAAEYAAKAAERRKEADMHRRMFAAFEQLVADVAAQPAPPAKRGKTFPSPKRAKSTKDQLAKYRTHCEAYVQGAEVLADEAERLAEFHRARARELRDARDP